MLKSKLIPLLLLAFLLAACGGTRQAEETQTPAPTLTDAPAQAAATSAATAPPQGTTQVSTGPATCTVVSVDPTPSPEQESLFPPVSEADWVLGPETAKVTIIEYSDFQ